MNKNWWYYKRNAEIAAENDKLSKQVPSDIHTEEYNYLGQKSLWCCADDDHRISMWYDDDSDMWELTWHPFKEKSGFWTRLFYVLEFIVSDSHCFDWKYLTITRDQMVKWGQVIENELKKKPQKELIEEEDDRIKNLAFNELSAKHLMEEEIVRYMFNNMRAAELRWLADDVLKNKYFCADTKYMEHEARQNKKILVRVVKWIREKLGV